MAEQAYAYVTLIPVAKGFQREVAKQLDGVGGVGGQAGKTTGKNFSDGFGGQIKKLGLLAAGALATAGVGRLLGDSIKQASDLGESVNAVNVAFGEAAQGVLKLGETSAKAMGVSQTEFNAAAVRFSAFAERVVGEGGNVSGFIGDISTRAADFASVFNIEVSEALQVFQSGLAGEAEPLKRFGINLLQSEVAAFAMANGIAESASAMTEAQKVQARYGLLMEQTRKTQGDFVNTSDSLANQQRILQAEFANVQASLGVALIPVLEKLQTIVIDRVLPAFEDFGSWLESPEGIAAIESFTAAVTGLIEGVINVGSAIGQNLPLLTGLGIAFAASTVQMTGFTISTVKARVAVRLLNLAIRANPIGALVSVLALAVTGVQAFINATQNATPTQDELNESIQQTIKELEFYRAEQGKTENTALYTSKINELEAALRDQRAALQESYNFTEAQEEASYRAADAAIAQRFATDGLIESTRVAEVVNTGYADSIDDYISMSALFRGTSDNIAEGLGNVAEQAALASLGLSQLSLVDQARAIQADEIARQQLYGGQAEDARSFTEILTGLHAQQQYGNALFEIAQEEIDAYAKKLGYQIEESTNATGSVTNYNTELDSSIDTTNQATNAVNGLAGAYGNLSNAIAGATPGDPGPGGMFEVQGPGGTYLASLDDSVRGQLNAIEANIAKEFGTQAVDRVLEQALGGTSRVIENTLRRGTEFVNEETGRRVVGNIQGARADELIAQGFKEVGKVSASNEDLTKAIEQLSDDISSGNVANYTPFAKGGLVTGPTRALIGEAGPEVVIPLNRFESMMDMGDGKTLVYNAAPNQTLDSEAALFQAMRRAKVVANW